MAQQITLTQFEAIDGAYNALSRMGDFMTCADPRAWIAQSQRLDGLCIEALGYDYVMQFESAEACAADLIVRALSSATLVVDEVA